MELWDDLMSMRIFLFLCFCFSSATNMYILSPKNRACIYFVTRNIQISSQVKRFPESSWLSARYWFIPFTWQRFFTRMYFNCGWTIKQMQDHRKLRTQLKQLRKESLEKRYLIYEPNGKGRALHSRKKPLLKRRWNWRYPCWTKEQNTPSALKMETFSWCTFLVRFFRHSWNTFCFAKTTFLSLHLFCCNSFFFFCHFSFTL